MLCPFAESKPVVNHGDWPRFLAKVVYAEESGCWLFTSSLDARGYGSFWFQGRAVRAHRWVWETLIGPLEDGEQIDHLCRVRNCVNPAHLEPVSAAENVMRGFGPTAINARKTACEQGHPLYGPNLRMEGSRRRCRTCAKLAQDRFRAKRCVAR
jgi:hypothetical protein